MAVKVALTIEQIAETLRGLKKDEIETLEIMLDSKTKKEILKRRREMRAGKRIPIDKMKSFQGI